MYVEENICKVVYELLWVEDCMSENVLMISNGELTMKLNNYDVGGKCMHTKKFLLDKTWLVFF